MARDRIATAALAFAVVAWAPPARAQHQVQLGFAISDPRGAFDDNTDTGLGFSGGYVYALDPMQIVSIGFTGSFLNYGSTERRVPLSTTVPDIDVDVDTNNNSTFIQGVLQLKAPTGVVKPYVQGTAGLGVFFTTTTLEDTRFNERILSDTNHSDTTFVWGGGGGLLIQIYTARRQPVIPGQEWSRLSGDDDRGPRVFLDLGARYLKGNEVEYLREGSLVTDEGTFDLDRRLVESGVELMQYTIGVAIEF